MSYSDRLKAAAVFAKVEYSQTAIAKSLSVDGKTVSKQAVDRWMAGGMPTAEMIFHIADVWRIDPRWLATGAGDMIPRVLMEPGAPEYRAFTEEALEVARGFDQLVPECREHVSRQVVLLRGAHPGNGGRRRAAQHDVEIKGGKYREQPRKKVKNPLR